MESLAIASDGLTALLGAIGRRDGVVVAAGTGTACLARRGELFAKVDGWGSLLSDAGSGFAIGRAGLDAGAPRLPRPPGLARASRGGGRGSALAQVEQLPEQIYSAPVPTRAVASFAEDAARAAEAGDAARPARSSPTPRASSGHAARAPPAGRPVRAGAGQALGLVRRAACSGAGELIAAPFRREAETRLPGSSIVEPEGDPLAGALLLAELAEELPEEPGSCGSGGERGARADARRPGGVRPGGARQPAGRAGAPGRDRAGGRGGRRGGHPDRGSGDDPRDPGGGRRARDRARQAPHSRHRGVHHARDRGRPGGSRRGRGPGGCGRHRAPATGRDERRGVRGRGRRGAAGRIVADVDAGECWAGGGRGRRRGGGDHARRLHRWRRTGRAGSAAGGRAGAGARGPRAGGGAIRHTRRWSGPRSGRAPSRWSWEPRSRIRKRSRAGWLARLRWEPMAERAATDGGALPARLPRGVPKGQALRAILEELLATLPAGAALPSERELAERYGPGAHDRPGRGRAAHRRGLRVPAPRPRDLRGRAADRAGGRAHLVHGGHARARAGARLHGHLERAGRGGRLPGGHPRVEGRRPVLPARPRAHRRRAPDGDRAGVPAARALPGHRRDRLRGRVPLRRARRSVRSRARRRGAARRGGGHRSRRGAAARGAGGLARPPLPHRHARPRRRSRSVRDLALPGRPLRDRASPDAGVGRTGGAAPSGGGAQRLAAAHQRAEDVQIVVEDGHVCGRARLETAEVVASEQPRRGARRGVHRVSPVGAARHQVADRLVHRQHASGQRAVGQPHGAVARPHRAAAQLVLARVEQCRLDRVGHEAEALARREEGAVGRLGREVHTVDDRLDGHVRAHERGAGDARIARPPAAVGVVYVRDGAGAAVEGGVRLRRVRVRVAARDHHVARHEPVDQFERTRQLGRERHGRHGAGAHKPLGEAQVRNPEMLRVMGTRPLRREERALEVHAQYQRERAAAVLGDRGGGRPQRLAVGALVRRDEGRLGAHHTRPRERLAGAAVGVRIGREEVDPVDAVDVHVDEPGNGDALGPGGRDAHPGNHPVLDVDVTEPRPARRRRAQP